MIGWSLADEDYDPRPVPPGCPACWRKDLSEVCLGCPDSAAAEEQLKQAREAAQGSSLR